MLQEKNKKKTHKKKPHKKKEKKKRLCLKILFKLLRIYMQNNLLLHEQFHFIDWIFLIFSHFSVLENKEKATPILYKVSDYVLAMSSTCYVLGETLWMHHFDYHETLMKNASEHFSVLITRFTMVVYLYNVKYFFVVEKKKKGAKEVMSHQTGKKKE